MSGMGDVVVAGGTESMSAVPMSGFHFRPNPWMVEHRPEAYVGMGLTAENVARKYGISRRQADEFSARSHERALGGRRGFSRTCRADRRHIGNYTSYS